jgi:hypothetical protein
MTGCFYHYKNLIECDNQDSGCIGGRKAILAGSLNYNTVGKDRKKTPTWAATGSTGIRLPRKSADSCLTGILSCIQVLIIRNRTEMTDDPEVNEIKLCA